MSIKYNGNNNNNNADNENKWFFSNQLSLNDIKQIQAILLRDEEVVFYFWLLCIFQAYYLSYMIHHAKLYQARVEIFQRDMANAIPIDLTKKAIDKNKIQIYSAQLCAKNVERKLIVQVNHQLNIKSFNISIFVENENEIILFGKKNITTVQLKEEYLNFPVSFKLCWKMY